jgi:hypothetical protein
LVDGMIRMVLVARFLGLCLGGLVVTGLYCTVM